jgi:hypothetical protein
MIEFLQADWKEIFQDLSARLRGTGWKDILGDRTEVVFDPEIARLFFAEYLAAAAKSFGQTSAPAQGGVRQ